MRRRWTGPILSALACAAVAGALAPAVAAGFTGTPAALRLVAKMRAAYAKLPGVSWVATGDVVYCPQLPEGWTEAPFAGCTVRARVSEEDQLIHGRVLRAVGTVSAPSRRNLPTLHYRLSADGWYERAAGARCWRRADLPFVAALWVSYPFPGQTLSIVEQTRSRVVIQALTPKFGLREFDYVNPATGLEPRSIAFTHTAHHTFEVSETETSLTAPPPTGATIVCATKPAVIEGVTNR